MTEKRFKHHMGLICEKRDGEYYSFTIREVCDLLNELHEENQQLKEELFELKKDYIMETYADNPIRRDDRLNDLRNGDF